MAVYRTSLEGLRGTNYRQDFFSTLLTCFSSICKEGALSAVDLAPPVNPPKPDEEVPHWQRGASTYARDVMLLRDGAPLLAVFLRYESSKGPKNLPGDEEPGYAEAPSYAGASLAEVQQSLGERLRAAVPAPEPEKPPKPSFIEGRWTIVLRTSSKDAPAIFQGSPLDINEVDRAFTVMVDMLVALIAPKPADTPLPQRA